MDRPNYRPDLATAEWTRLPFVFDRVAPALARLQPGGTLNYTPWTNRGSAQTGRTKYASLTHSHMGGAELEFVCSEISSTKDMAQADVVAGYADLTHAELAMAAAGKDEVNTNLETTLANLVLANATDIKSDTNIPGTIENAAALLADKCPDCKVALVMSSRVFTKLKTNTEIKARMQNTGIAIGEGGDPRKITQAQMAAIFGVDEVIVGKNISWGTSKCALVVLPTEGKNPNEEVQLARTLIYKYDPVAGIPFECTSWYDNDTRLYNVDTMAHGCVKMLNSTLKKAFTVFDADASESGSGSASGSASGSTSA